MHLTICLQHEGSSDWLGAGIRQLDGNVITSYSIHYTKLYDVVASASGQPRCLNRPVFLLLSGGRTRLAGWFFVLDVERNMRVADFSFDLPEELIARYPMAERSASRLLSLDGNTGELRHGIV